MNFIKTKLLGYVRNNWQLKLTSLLLAIIVWFVICEYVDPDTETYVSDIKIDVNYQDSVPQREGLGIMTAVDQTVSVKLSGSRDTIALMNRGKIKASLDLNNVTRSGVYDLPVRIDLGGQNLTLMEQTISTVKVHFDENIVVNVPVHATTKGKVAEGLIMEEPTVLDSVIPVTGPKAIVETIVSAEIVVSQEIFSETATFSDQPYTFVDKDGKVVPMSFLTVDEDKKTTSVTVTIVKEKSIPLVVSVVNNSGGMDSSFCTAKIEPESLLVTANPEVINKQNAIDIGVIDVSERNDDFETTVKVVLPNGMKNVNNVETVKVSVSFNDAQTKIIQVRNIKLDNLPNSTKVVAQEQVISVKVRGIPEDLKKLNESNVSIVADLRNKTPGKDGANRITGVVVFPDNLKVGAVGKYHVTVVQP